MAITHSEIVSMMKLSRSIATDDFALQTIDVFPFWESMIGVEISQEDIQKGYDRYQYNGELYAVIQPHTPQEGWEPDKVPALWKKVSLEEWPEFKQPTGAHDAYNIGDKITFNGKKYISLINGNAWSPEAYPAGWKLVEESTESEDETEETPIDEYPEWVQPTGAHDAYNIGDHVTYQGEHYISNINGNTTVPGSDERWWTKVQN